MKFISVFKKRKTWVLIFLILYIVPYIFTTYSTQRSRGGDFRIFLVAGDRFIQGTPLYEGSKVASWVTWPPFFAVFIAPFTMLSKVNIHLTQVLWYLLNTFLFFISIGIWIKILCRKPFARFDESKGLSFYSPVVVISLLLVTGPFADNVAQLQFGAMLLFLMTLGINDLQENRPWRAGFWFGAAAALKAFPVMIIIYLVYRKKSRALLSMVLSGAVLTMLPVFRYGIHEYVESVRAWIAISFSGGYPLGGLNQSVYAMIGRYLAIDPFVMLVKRMPSPPVDDPGIIATTWIWRGLFVLFILALAWVLKKRNYRNIGVETAFLIVLITVFSPISWQHYYVLMLPGIMAVTQWWLEKKDPFLKWTALGSGILLTGLYILGQCGKPIGQFLRCILSHYTLAAFALLAGLVYCMAKGYGNQADSGITPDGRVGQS